MLWWRPWLPSEPLDENNQLYTRPQPSKEPGKEASKTEVPRTIFFSRVLHVSYFPPTSMSSDDSQLDISLQEEEYTPKRPCGSRGTTIEISKRFVQKLGSAADRLNLSSTQLTGILAAATNHGGGDIGMIALSKSTTNRLRTASRKEEAKLIRNDFTCDIEDLKWQIKSTFFRFLQKQWR